WVRERSGDTGAWIVACAGGVPCGHDSQRFAVCAPDVVSFACSARCIRGCVFCDYRRTGRSQGGVDSARPVTRASWTDSDREVDDLDGCCTLIPLSNAYSVADCARPHPNRGVLLRLDPGRARREDGGFACLQCDIDGVADFHSGQRTVGALYVRAMGKHERVGCGNASVGAKYIDPSLRVIRDASDSLY